MRINILFTVIDFFGLQEIDLMVKKELPTWKN